MYTILNVEHNTSEAYHLHKLKLVVVVINDVPLKRSMTDDGSKEVEAKLKQ